LVVLLFTKGNKMDIGLYIYIFSTIIHLALSVGILYNLKKAGEFEKTDIAFFIGLAICPIVNTVLILLVVIFYVKRLLNIIGES